MRPTQSYYLAILHLLIDRLLQQLDGILVQVLHTNTVFLTAPRTSYSQTVLLNFNGPSWPTLTKQ